MCRNSTTRWSETLSAASPRGTGGSRRWSATSPASTETSQARYSNLRSPPASSDRTGTIAPSASSAPSSHASSERSLVSATISWSPADPRPSGQRPQLLLLAPIKRLVDGEELVVLILAHRWRPPLSSGCAPAGRHFRTCSLPSFRAGRRAASVPPRSQSTLRARREGLPARPCRQPRAEAGHLDHCVAKRSSPSRHGSSCSLADDLAADFRTALGVRLEVEILEPETLPLPAQEETRLRHRSETERPHVAPTSPAHPRCPPPRPTGAKTRTAWRADTRQRPRRPVSLLPAPDRLSKRMFAVPNPVPIRL